MIYAHLFGGEEVSVGQFGPFSKRPGQIEVRQRDQTGRDRFCSSNIQIMLACRQLYSETRLIYFELNVFNLKTFMAFYRFKRLLNSNQRQAIRTIRVRVDDLYNLCNEIRDRRVEEQAGESYPPICSVRDLAGLAWLVVDAQIDENLLGKTQSKSSITTRRKFFFRFVDGKQI
jgi:hypothetical protein